MRFEIISEGVVHQCPISGPDSVAGTSRCAVARSGELVCSYMLNSGLGVNGFTPCLARSGDGGEHWEPQGPVWPHLREGFSMNPSVSRAPDGELFLFGSSTPITEPGETFWFPETRGILPNDLIWSRSSDDGRTWLEPRIFPLPFPGAAETPAPLCITRSRRWLAPYAPHNTDDPALAVDLRHIVVMISDDEGGTWRPRSMIRVEDNDSAMAEAWVVELSNGALLGACWHLRRSEGDDYPNAFALSSDGGENWFPTHHAPILGQSVGLAPWGEEMALFVYNQRRHGTPGVWLAVAKPTESDFGVLANQVVWEAETATRGVSSGKSEEWTDFAFGEPSATVLPDDTILVTFWCIQPSSRGIRFVKLRFI